MFTRPRVVPMLVVLLAGIHGCATEPYSNEGFRFPIINGDIDRGRESFVALQCHRCHTVKGVELPAYQGESPLSLELGGEIIYVKTYGELVTSIINPSHVMSKEYTDSLAPEDKRQLLSPMPFNREMTIEQLVNVVTFLNSRYVLLEPDYLSYTGRSDLDYR